MLSQTTPSTDPTDPVSLARLCWVDSDPSAEVRTRLGRYDLSSGRAGPLRTAAELLLGYARVRCGAVPDAQPPAAITVATAPTAATTTTTTWDFGVIALTYRVPFAVSLSVTDEQPVTA